MEERSGTSHGRLSLAGWLPGDADFVDLGSAVSRIGATLTFKISPRQLWRNERTSSDDPEVPHSEQQWILLVRAQRKGTMVGASPITWPKTLELAAIRPERHSGNPELQLSTTPGGSVMITARRPKRSTTWHHRPRLVV
jgi:hypothetical protein